MSEAFLHLSPWIGALAAVLTTICWLPQAIRVVRHRETRAISLTTNVVFAAGIVCWLVYGLTLRDWPLIGANGVSLVFTAIIIAMKLRHG